MPDGVYSIRIAIEGLGIESYELIRYSVCFIYEAEYLQLL